jgi:flagellar biosynthesis protein FlhA
MIGRLVRNNSDLSLVAVMIGILLVLFAPIPTTLLDFLIILNFSFGLTLLMLTFYVGKPVELSTFPSLLLVATLYRLSLNVAATRLILTEGDAGQVIGAVGSFAVQGNFVVGLVVFFILIVVQYVVVTAGAQRVSEVAARFTLDAVPGQQMSIDADLNMGLIDQDEARERRRRLERETAFYGAMDGASKFVKGDAIAGIIIVLINIIAGWIIGISQRGLDWSEALQQYTLLTIGDGIVTQVPALIISIATGIIVTRSAADRQLSLEVADQLSSVPRVPIIVMTALTLLLMLPGMPKWPIAILLLLFASAWFAARRKRARDAAFQEEEVALDKPADLTLKVPANLAVGLGAELAQSWSAQRGHIAERIAALRTDHASRTGLILPSIVVENMAGLGPFHYDIRLHGASYAGGLLYPERTLAVRSDASKPGIDGIETIDPAFGLPAWWVEDKERDRACELGYTLVDPLSAMLAHLSEVVRSEAPLLLTRGDVMLMLDGVRTRQPGLVEELIPTIMSVSDVQRVLQNLLAEQVSIRSMDLICEILVDVGRAVRDHSELTELVRQRMSHVICNDLKGSDPELAVISLDPRIESQVTEAVSRNPTGAGLVIEPRLAESLLRKTLPMADRMTAMGLSPVLLCGPAIRRPLRSFMSRSIPRLSVVSVAEVPQSIALKSFDVIRESN